MSISSYNSCCLEASEKMSQPSSYDQFDPADPTPINLKDLLGRFKPQDRSPHANIDALCQLRCLTIKTLFFAATERASPTQHLSVLRGSQDDDHLLTNDYMSPGLHNSSDTYHRFIRRKVFYCREIRAGEHNNCVKPSFFKTYLSLQRLSSFVEFNAYRIIPGLLPEAGQTANQEARDELRKVFFTYYEADKMRRRAWEPRDWEDIQAAVITEAKSELRAIFFKSRASSFNSETAYPSVFDDSEDEAYGSDGMSESFSSVESGCSSPKCHDSESLEPNKQSTTGESQTPNSSDEKSETLRPADGFQTLSSNDQSSSDKHQYSSSVEQVTTPASNPSTSPLLQSLFYGSGEDSENEDEDEEPVNPNSIESEISQASISPAQSRRQAFLKDLLEVRKDAAIDMEAYFENEALEEARTERIQNRQRSQQLLPIHVISLRLQMFANNVIGVNHSYNKLFRSRTPVGYHEVEFVEHIRYQLMDRGEFGMGTVVDAAFWAVVDDKENMWEKAALEGDSHAGLRDEHHLALAVQAWGCREFYMQLKAVSDVAADVQHEMRARAFRAIQRAMGATFE